MTIKPAKVFAGIAAALLSVTAGCDYKVCWDACPEEAVELPSYTVEMGEITVPPGEEFIYCVVKEIGNTEQIRVGRIENELTTSVHHVAILLAYNQEERTTPGVCPEFENALDPEKEVPLLVTQIPEESIVFPEGVGLTLEAGQMIKMEMHFFNPTDETVVVNSVQTFHQIAEEDYQYELGILGVQTPDISLPPRTDVTVGPSTLPLPADLADANFFSITGHTHERGTEVTIEALSGGATMMYEEVPFNWSEPEVVYFDPPIANVESLRWTCEYSNQTDQQIDYGCTAKDEMCMFWTYFYKDTGEAPGARVCVRSEAGNFHGCCPGDQWFCDFLKLEGERIAEESMMDGGT